MLALDLHRFFLSSQIFRTRFRLHLRDTSIIFDAHDPEVPEYKAAFFPSRAPENYLTATYTADASTVVTAVIISLFHDTVRGPLNVLSILNLPTKGCLAKDSSGQRFISKVLFTDLVVG